ncbi:hypothetical protein OQA88_1536 [Cercophora sp. LCS_1]
MHCSICRRPHSPNKLPFLCAVDARNRLYESRLDIAQALIQSEEVERQVELVLSGPASTTSARARDVGLKSEEKAARDRISEIIAQADRLRVEIEAARKDIEAKKESLARRKSELASVSLGSSARKSRQLEEAERSLQRSKYNWARSYESMVATRAFLCEEAARLYGLRQVRKGSAKRYEIGGVEILELQAMNNASPELISTSLAHVAHILVLASHYLAIRLPAEITLPHRDYPRPTIFALNSSYRHGKVAFPGSTAAPQLPSVVSDGLAGDVKIRPLYIDKPLQTLAKDDPSAYAHFIEGVSFLAYDIAWACCSQGVTFGEKESYDDIANMGQNLWRLLIGDQVHRRAVEPTFPPSLPPSGNNTPSEESAEMVKAKPMIGRWSHGTAHGFLGGSEGAERIEKFKLLTPLKLADQLKKRLSTVTATLDQWEEIEVSDAVDGLEDVAVVHRRGDGAAGRGTGLGGANVATGSSAGSENGNNPTRSSGNSGWTRIKNR